MAIEKAIVFPMSACSSHYKNNASNICDARRVKNSMYNIAAEYIDTNCDPNTCICLLANCVVAIEQALETRRYCPIYHLVAIMFSNEEHARIAGIL